MLVLIEVEGNIKLQLLNALNNILGASSRDMYDT